MPSEIVVTARPFAVFLQTDFYDFQGGGSPAGPGLVWAELVMNDIMMKDNVRIDDDVNTPEIVVTAQKIKNALIGIGGASGVNAYSNTSLDVPCSGNYSFNEIMANVKNLNFRLVSSNFGPGRAGENHVGSDGNNVPVLINAQMAKLYTDLPNGALYLVAHEVAHSLNSMQQYNNQLWQQYVAQNPGQTQEQLVASYPQSPEFAANEARANSIAKRIAEYTGFGAMSPDPTHGYETC
ncbi:MULTISPECIES: hypothetical protein [Sphingobium]|uniref:hypothetical protein n=1 Tax=Sphingobium TaxID=165695 RepID=UPI0015ECBD4A|nr:MULTISPECIES: hypothetical protein [Sphingobium]MCW2361628.1 hypothetical protein [Sphingobium sp. B10D3B]MCW2401693.1 hypothetical protein [Sphingobium sp. B10D7B]MCW2408673.1 hypothetical protein [Sphingobium xanthum]